MKKQIKQSQIDFVGVSQEDVIELPEENGKTRSIVDIQRIKAVQGASFIQINDEKEGLIVTCQSFKEPLIDIANLSLSLFDNIKFKRNLPVERGYIK
jgi:hypothetical protein